MPKAEQMENFTSSNMYRAGDINKINFNYNFLPQAILMQDS